MKYLCRIRYVGTEFCGFQVQPVGRTVQGVLNEAVLAVFGEGVKITGCSRTDSGVHANEFYVTVEPPQGPSVPAEKLPLALKAHLPSDLSLTSAVLVEDTFHPRYDAVGKEYVYLICNGAVPDPFLHERSWHVPRPIGEERLSLMRRFAEGLEGKHDFSSFMAAGSDVKDTVRTLHRLSVEKEGDLIRVTAVGDGFLYKMVRILVGTLVDAAFGRFSPEDAPSVLEARDRAAAGATAPSAGLYLNRVFYEMDNFASQL
jgi:tRNA pseudouridine38-40 synthase